MNFKLTILLLCTFLKSAMTSYCQGEENVWAFGLRAGIDFNTIPPTAISTFMSRGEEVGASICDSNGQLLFYTSGYWIWNRNHELLPELTNGQAGIHLPTAPTVGYPALMEVSGAATQQAAICPMPGHPNRYYVFSLHRMGQLYYTVVDRSLNNGMGGIVSGLQGVPLTSGLAGKMTLVEGCNNIWLVVRSKASNNYLAYDINNNGISTNPVVSNAGNLPLDWYNNGVLKRSAAGIMLVAACNNRNSGGLEVYDFDPFSGLLSNAQVLDSNSTDGYYYGACFSPDGAKLYGSTTSFRMPVTNTFMPGRVRQFDLSLGNTAAISGSNTLVFTDVQYPNTELIIGDLKRAKDGKIYFGSGSANASLGAGAMHRITSPNLAGVACDVNTNAIILNSSTWSYRSVPNDIAIAPIPDSKSRRIDTIICFSDSAVLVADSGKQYLWNNGGNSRGITVFQNGTYIVQYINRDCAFQTDTMKVHFYRMPAFSTNGYSCPGSGQGRVDLTSSDHYTYRLYHEDTFLQEVSSSNGASMTNLDTGNHKVQILTPDGCDTIITIRIDALPVPEAHILGDTVVCTNQASMYQYDGQAPQQEWLFSNGAEAGGKAVETIFYHDGPASARLIVTNAEGCKDTTILGIQVRKLDLQLMASEKLARKGSTVRLQSMAAENYDILYWQPQELLGNSTSKWQEVNMDSSTTFYVTAVSADGCETTASVLVEVLSELQMPNAFTPNGDGKNDRFAPKFRGDVLIRKFEVYNRWGQVVYSAWGLPAQQGWDGSYNGKPCDLGTYFYYINVEVQQGKTIERKGDVILMR